jgi:hypothetical protein
LIGLLFFACSKNDKIQIKWNLSTVTAVKDTSSHIYFVGHAYGHHRDTNKSLCFPLKNFFIGSVWDSTKAVIFGGDFSRQANNEAWQDFKTSTNTFKEKTFISIGNHDIPLRDSINQKYPDNIELDRQTQLILMDFESIPYDLSEVDTEILLEMLNKEYQNHIIVGHKVWWLGQKMTVGVDNHRRDSFKSTFWEKVYPAISDNGKNYYFFAGDVGGNDGVNPLYYRRLGNIQLIGQGIGHSDLLSVLRVQLESDSLLIKVINIETGEATILNEQVVNEHIVHSFDSSSKLKDRSFLIRLFHRIGKKLSSL